MPKTRTYRPRVTRVTSRQMRADIKTIAAMAFVNGITFEAQLIALVMGELG